MNLAHSVFCATKLFGVLTGILTGANIAFLAIFSAKND